MVRIRFEFDIDSSSALNSFSNYSLETDNKYITIEQEKNNDKHFKANANLKEIVTKEKNGESYFNVIGIQTITTCNMTCSFCPINKNLYKLEQKKMPWLLINKIAGELKEINYNNQILLFTNNEPLLDDRIVAITQLFKINCPDSLIKISTNGILLNNQLVKDLFDAGLSYLTINNYTDSKRLITPVKNILTNAKYFKDHDIRIHVRNKNQILTTRAGQAPNKVIKNNKSLNKFCALPFTDINISYNGIVNQCCFDALSQSNFGNININSLLEIWRDRSFMTLRKYLCESSRYKNVLCRKCDFDGFRTPFHYSIKFTREDII